MELFDLSNVFQFVPKDGVMMVLVVAVIFGIGAIALQYYTRPRKGQYRYDMQGIRYFGMFE